MVLPWSCTCSTTLRVRATPEPRVGLVVGKAVGNAVVRNRVKRQLRHLVRDHLTHLPASSDLVIRALPPAAGMASTELGAELDPLSPEGRARGPSS